MANLYEFEVNRGIAEQLVEDINLTLGSEEVDEDADIIENLMFMFDKPTWFQKVSMDGKPGFHVRIGEIRTERFNGSGLHVYIHSGSEGYLDMLEFDRRLKNSLDRQLVEYYDRT